MSRDWCPNMEDWMKFGGCARGICDADARELNVSRERIGNDMVEERRGNDCEKS
jgi:hypothetical protein